MVLEGSLCQVVKSLNYFSNPENDNEQSPIECCPKATAPKSEAELRKIKRDQSHPNAKTDENNDELQNYN